MAAAFTTIASPVEAEIVVKKSRFIAYLAPAENEEAALSVLEARRGEHRMARHNVYAYVLADGTMRYSDDGEPAQTAGRPCLDRLLGSDLSNVIVVVTRYFGGTLLGTGGLVRAYGQAVSDAVEKAQLLTMRTCVDVSCELPYKLYEPATRLATQLQAQILDASFGETVRLRLRVEAEHADELQRHLQELSHGQASIEASEPFEAPI